MYQELHGDGCRTEAEGAHNITSTLVGWDEETHLFGTCWILLALFVYVDPVIFRD